MDHPLPFVNFLGVQVSYHTDNPGKQLYSYDCDVSLLLSYLHSSPAWPRELRGGNTILFFLILIIVVL